MTRNRNSLVTAIGTLCLVTGFSLNAQDTINLQGVEITASKYTLSQVGKKTEVIDSNTREQYRFSSVADLVSLNSPVYVRSYGQGGVASMAFRGGNAAQSAVIWNGFNLQNTMLGQADVALLPAIVFDQVTLAYGGAAALWGSGAVGGSLHLDNALPFDQGVWGRANFGAGSTGLMNASAVINVSRKRYISSTKVYDTYARNDFKYLDTLETPHSEKRQKNAAYNFTGLMQEFRFLIGSTQTLSINGWANTNQRRLPSYNPVVENKTYQDDRALRLTTDWALRQRQFSTVVKAGYFDDVINYTDSLVPTFSKSRVRILLLENENYYTWHKWQFNLGINQTSSFATSNNYDGDKSLSRTSLLLGARSDLVRNKLLFYVAGRAEYISVGTLPVTGNVSLEYKVHPTLSALLNVARVYRQPTLNDLYWVPGGNPDLKPEKGNTIEGTLEFKKRHKGFLVFISGAAYTRLINDWIAWVPGQNGNPSPTNIQKVWSRGAETTWRVKYEANHYRWGASVLTSYVLSTLVSSTQENNNAEGRQLVYTPRYTVNGNILAGYRNLEIVFFQQYIGYRFIASDNSAWLPPYNYASLKFNYRVDFIKFALDLFTGINNLFNENYVNMPGYRVPLRNYELGITLLIKTNKK